MPLSFSFVHFQYHLSLLVLQMCCFPHEDVSEVRVRPGSEVGSQFCSVFAGLSHVLFEPKAAQEVSESLSEVLHCSCRSIFLSGAASFASQLEPRPQAPVFVSV